LTAVAAPADAAEADAPPSTDATDATDADTDALPDDFPFRDKLAANGIDTYTQVRAMSHAALVDLPGIGRVSADKILDAARALEIEREGEAEEASEGTNDEAAADAADTEPAE